MKWMACALLLLLALGCTNNMKIPPEVIQRPQMEKVLWEMLQADRFAASFIQSQKDTLDRNRKETIALYDKVFSYNGITRQQFFDSYKFYAGRPDILKVMYDSIATRAERRRSDIYKRSNTDSTGTKKDSVHKDSLRPVRDSVRNHLLRNRSDSLRRRTFPKLSTPRLP